MKTLRILGLFFIAGLLFSCEKDIEKDQIKQDVVFGIDHIDPYELKSDVWDIDCPDNLVPEKAHIIIDGVDYYPEVFQINGKWYSQAIKLAPDTYTIEYFALVVSDGNNGYIAIMATPAPDSEYEIYIPENMRIGREFTVNDFGKTEIEVAVLCYEEAYYYPFGFFWFYIDRIVLREMCFFGDLCIEDASMYAGSPYAVDGFPTEGFWDAPAIFEVRVFKNGEPVEKSPFSNLEWNGIGSPLCVEYPDRIDVEGEVFTFEIWVLVPTNFPGIFDYQLYATFETVDGYPLDEAIDGEDMVIFSIGECAYNPDEVIIEIPWKDAPDVTVNKGFGFRIKGKNSGKELYLGVADYGNVSTNRVEMDGVLPDGTHNVTFSYDDNTDNFALIVLADAVTYYLNTNLTAHTDEPCEGLNALEIFVHDRRTDGAIQWENVALDLAGSETSLGTFESYDKPGTTANALTWYFLNDFTQSFTITANLQVEGLGAANNVNETLKAEMNIVCLTVE